jgi:hypothetical protein
MRAVLEAFRDDLSSRGISFLAVIVPSFENVQDPAFFITGQVPREQRLNNERLAAELCAELAIPFVDLTGIFLPHRDEVLYDPQDHHLSPRGTSVAGEAIAAALPGG